MKTEESNMQSSVQAIQSTTSWIQICFSKFVTNNFICQNWKI